MIHTRACASRSAHEGEASTVGVPTSALPGEDTLMVIPRQRKSHPWLPVDNEENDVAQADEEPLASLSVSAARRFLIEDDEGRRCSMLV